MEYHLYKAVLGRNPKIEITKERYDALQSSWAFVDLMSSLEEQWDCVIQNYIELEQEILKEAVNSMILLIEQYDEFSDVRLGFARKLSNFLSSARAYLDFTPKLLSKSGQPETKAAFKEATHAAYDRFFGYRFMEALRNYSQHAGLPIHGAGMRASWIEDEITGERTGTLRHTVQANINLQTLRSDGAFKKSILDEMDLETKQLNMAPALREYLEGLGEVHDNLRSVLKSEFEDAKHLIREAINEYSVANDGNVIGLSIAQFDDAKLITKQSIFEDLIKRITRLQTRNGTLKNFQKRYVSSQIVD